MKSQRLIESAELMKMAKVKQWDKSNNKNSDDMDEATSIRRPFVKLYKEFKWLNAFAIINDVAIQETLKNFDQHYFISNKCSLLRHNLESIAHGTRMHKDHKVLIKVSENIVEVYANLFFGGNLGKAKKEIDAK